MIETSKILGVPAMGISIPHGETTICLYGIQRERVLRITSSLPEGGTMWTKGRWTTKLYSEEQPKPTASQANYKPTARKAMLINGRAAVPTVTGFLFVSAGNDTLPDLVSLCNGKFLQWPNIERHRGTEQIQREGRKSQHHPNERCKRKRLGKSPTG